MHLLFLLSCNSPANDSASNLPMTEALLETELTRLGNLESERERHQGLMALNDVLKSQHVFEAVQEDIDILLPIIDMWANGRERYWLPGDQDSAGEDGYLGGFFVMRVFPGQTDNSYPPPISSDILLPMWKLYRGRMLIWTAIENGLLSDLLHRKNR